MMAGTQRDDFDRSFDFFENNGEGSSSEGPWTEKNWKSNPADTSFDTDIFEFTATLSNQYGSEDHGSQTSIFPEDPFSASFEKPTKVDTIQVAVQEQLSALYDDVSSEPTCQVEGSIYVKSRSQMEGIPFCITLRDLMVNLNRVEATEDLGQDVSDKISRKGLHRSDRVLRVRLPPESGEGEMRIANYFCSSTLRPVPLVCMITVVWWSLGA